MERRRVRDGLVGAAITVGVLVLLVVLVGWWVTEPAADDPGVQASATSSASPGSPGSPGAAAPDAGQGDLGPDDLGPGDTWLGDFTLDAGAVVTPDSRLRDLHAVGRDARTGSDGLTAGTLTVDVTVPFEVVAEQIGGRTTLRRADGGSGATLVRTVEIAGRELRVAVTGGIEASDGRIVIEPTSIDLGGPEVLGRGLAAVARRLVTIDQPVEGLPDGLVLQDVRVRDDGLRATLRGRDVVLAP